MKYSLIPVLFALTLLTGCVTTNVTPLSSQQYAPIDPSEVVLYLHEADIPGSYEKVAIIYAKGDYAMTDESQMFNKARKRAAKLGANGVLIERMKEPGTGAKVAQAVLGVSAERKGEMIAIFVYQ